MKTYRVKAIITISLSTLVKAKSEKEAVELARSRELQSLPDDGYYTADEYWCHSGELDGEPQELTAEEEVEI
jgi:hypothetical protein